MKGIFIIIIVVIAVIGTAVVLYLVLSPPTFTDQPTQNSTNQQITDTVPQDIQVGLDYDRKANMRQIRTAIEIYKNFEGDYPKIKDLEGLRDEIAYYLILSEDQSSGEYEWIDNTSSDGYCIFVKLLGEDTYYWGDPVELYSMPVMPTSIANNRCARL